MVDGDKTVSSSFCSFFTDAPLKRSLRLTTAAGLLLNVVVIVTLYMWNQSEWMNFPGPFAIDWEGYTVWDFWAIFTFTLAAPVGFCLIFTVLQHYIRSSATRDGILHYCLAVGSMVAFLLAYAIFGFVWGWNILQCGVLFCINTDSHIIQPYDPPQPESGLGFKSTIGMSYLLSCSLLLVAVLYNASQHLLARRARSKDANDLQMALMDSTTVQSDSTPAPASAAAPPARYQPYNTAMGVRPAPDAADAHTAGHAAAQLRRAWLLYAGCAAALLCFWFTTTYVPNSWEYFSPSRIAAKADEMAVHVAAECGDWPHKSCPEYGWALLKTYNWALTDHFNAKLYPSNTIFFLFVLLVPLFALVVRSVPRAEAFFARKVRVSGSLWGALTCRQPSLRTAFFSFKEAAFLLATALAAYLFFHYWFFDHNFNGYWPPREEGAPYIELSERLARAMGQVAVLFMSLLMFPAARNSPLLALLGVSWEAAIQYHRWLGVAFLVFTVLHMVGVYWWYWVNGLFPQELVAIPNHLPTSIDNFTVPLMQFVTWIAVVTLGALALYEPVRRKRFDLFLFAHHFTYMILIPAVLWHAAAAWEYLLPGLAVWFGDRCVRAYRSVQAVALAPEQPAPDAVDVFDPAVAAAYPLAPVAPRLSCVTPAPPLPADLPRVVPAPSGRAVAAVHRHAAGDFIELRIARHFDYFPGHYAFLNVAEVSLFEWHPFTIASPVHPHAPAEIVFIIKTMGPGTWTQSLYSYVLDAQRSQAAAGGPPAAIPLTVSVDGPYGLPVDFAAYDSVLLVAGGVGVTPCKAIFESLYLSHIHDTRPEQRDAFPSGPRRVHLMFSARHPDLFSIMEPCLRHVPAGPFTANLFCDNPAAAHDADAPRGPLHHLTFAGRPDVEKELLGALGEDAAEHGKVLVFVCGPEGLAKACEGLAHKHGWDYHTETFAL